MSRNEAERSAFLAILTREHTEMAREAAEKLADFRDLVVQENQKQNLTRLLSPDDFYEGHVRDCLELLASGFLEYPAMDLGSGVGVPGIICGILSPHPWVLVESERKKAEFLLSAVEALRLSNISVVGERAEKGIHIAHVKTVVVRAVGKVEAVFGWIRKCSTWNTLVLLKGKSWGEEWELFRRSKWRDELLEAGKREYSVGVEKKYRVIVQVGRRKVPRGT